MCYNENPPELHTQSYLEAHVDSLTSGIVKPAVDSIEAVSGLAQGLLCYFEELRGSYTGEVRHNLASNALIHLEMMRVNIFDEMMRRVLFPLPRPTTTILPPAAIGVSPWERGSR